MGSNQRAGCSGGQRGSVDGKLLKGDTRVMGDSGYTDSTGILLTASPGIRRYLGVVGDGKFDQISRGIK